MYTNISSLDELKKLNPRTENIEFVTPFNEKFPKDIFNHFSNLETICISSEKFITPFEYTIPFKHIIIKAKNFTDSFVPISETITKTIHLGYNQKDIVFNKETIKTYALTDIIFGGSFDPSSPIENIFKDNFPFLTNIQLGGTFDKNINHLSFPPSLEKLRLSFKFNSILDLSSYLNLKELTFGNCFNRNDYILPKSIADGLDTTNLSVIDFGVNYNKPIVLSDYQNLKLIILKGNFDSKITFNNCLIDTLDIKKIRKQFPVLLRLPYRMEPG